MEKMLIVIDAQYDFVTGSLGSKEAEKAIPILEKLIRDYDWDRLIFTRDLHESKEEYLKSQEGRLLPVPHCIVETSGSFIVTDLLCKVPDKIINKSTFGSLTKLPNYVGKCENLKEIVIAGFCTDICVISNALILKAAFPEIKITVIENACAGSTVEKHNSAIDVLKSCQINIDKI